LPHTEELHRADEVFSLQKNGHPIWKCMAWAKSFLFLLDNGTSLTEANNSGKTAIDFINELRSSPNNIYARTHITSSPS
jgi:hypothetical protein